MGSQARNKADRNNMKVIVKDLMTEVLLQELAKEVAKAVIAHTNTRLDSLEKHINERISKMEENHKTIMSGVLRAGTPLYDNK